MPLDLAVMGSSITSATLKNVAFKVLEGSAAATMYVGGAVIAVGVPIVIKVGKDIYNGVSLLAEDALDPDLPKTDLGKKIIAGLVGAEIGIVTGEHIGGFVGRHAVTGALVVFVPGVGLIPGALWLAGEAGQITGEIAGRYLGATMLLEKCYKNGVYLFDSVTDYAIAGAKIGYNAGYNYFYDNNSQPNNANYAAAYNTALNADDWISLGKEEIVKITTTEEEADKEAVLINLNGLVNDFETSNNSNKKVEITLEHLQEALQNINNQNKTYDFNNVKIFDDYGQNFDDLDKAAKPVYAC